MRTRLPEPATLTTERHNGAVWLCVVSGSGVEMLARFGDEAAAQRFDEVLAARMAAAHAAGALGI